jgi:hypothetical protein
MMAARGGAAGRTTVAAVDFGTSGSSVALVFRGVGAAGAASTVDDVALDSKTKRGDKSPTAVLVKRADMSTVAFGEDALDEYSALEDDERDRCGSTPTEPPPAVRLALMAAVV